MKIKIPKTTHKLDLVGFDPSYAGQSVSVWVNPPVEEVAKAIRQINEVRDILGKLGSEKDKAKLDGYRDRLTAIGTEQQEFFARVTDWTLEEIQEFIQESSKTDPRLWSWIFTNAVIMIRDYQANLKKS